MINEKLSDILIIKTKNFTTQTGTGWKRGSFTVDNIDGYTLVAVQNKSYPYNDANQVLYNMIGYTSTDTSITVAYRAYHDYSGSATTAQCYLIYAKNSIIN